LRGDHGSGWSRTRWTKDRWDSFTAVKAAGLGFLLSAVNPKNLLMCAAAGSSIATGELSGAQDAWAVVVFTVVAGSTVALPVIAYALARDRMAGPLDELKAWLTVHNAAVATCFERAPRKARARRPRPGVSTSGGSG
jgi:threonine/homoserine/homoserine lactone efflux protein